MSSSSRRRTAATAAAAAPTAETIQSGVQLVLQCANHDPRPSGRFDAFVDMGNPMKGINLFPYLERRLEGRALFAVGPAAELELARTVSDEGGPRRWFSEVQNTIFILSIVH